MDGQVCDILILGAGPAGISAALTAHARGRTVAVLGADPMRSPLAKAPRIDNYPGLPAVSGRELLRAMLGGLADRGISPVTCRVTGAIAFGGQFMVSAERDVYQARALILAAGAQQGTRPFPGEGSLLGRGVSYCATCDGMLYRGKRVAVLGLGGEGERDAAFLRGIGCEVLYFDPAQAKNVRIKGEEKVTGLVCGGEEYAVDGVFILRDAVAAGALLPELAMDGGHIVVDENMASSVPGVFAAGDCVGRPYQIARAVGQGNTAALSADRYLKERDK